MKAKKLSVIGRTILVLAMLWGFANFITHSDVGNYDKTAPKISGQRQTLRNNYISPSVNIERRIAGHDQDMDEIDDLADIVKGARTEVERSPRYVSTYYSGGYPPVSEGVCTDVIWRAFREAGYDLKGMVDKDIASNPAAYPRVEGAPDPNIDFRRVPNLVSFFKRHASILSIKVVPNNIGNLSLWQGGDIVVYGAPLWHIGIVSDKRRDDGVPLLIHNGGPYAAENDMLLDWPSPIIYHFRFPGGN